MATAARSRAWSSDSRRSREVTKPLTTTCSTAAGTKATRVKATNRRSAKRRPTAVNIEGRERLGLRRRERTRMTTTRTARASRVRAEKASTRSAA